LLFINFSLIILYNFYTGWLQPFATMINCIVYGWLMVC